MCAVNKFAHWRMSFKSILAAWQDSAGESSGSTSCGGGQADEFNRRYVEEVMIWPVCFEITVANVQLMLAIVQKYLQCTRI